MNGDGGDKLMMSRAFLTFGDGCVGEWGRVSLFERYLTKLKRRRQEEGEIRLS